MSKRKTEGWKLWPIQLVDRQVQRVRDEIQVLGL